MVQAVCAIQAVVKECGTAPRRMLPQNLAGMERRASPELAMVEQVGRVGVLALPNTPSPSHSPASIV